MNAVNTNLLNNSINNSIDINYIIIFLVIMYGLIFVYENTNLHEHDIFKLFIFVLILYVASINIVGATIIAFIVLLLSQNTIMKNLLNNEKFTQYLNNPLKNKNDLEKINDSLNLTLITPNEKYNNMVNEGKKMVNKSYELKNDAIKNNDEKLKLIADNLLINGNTLIQSGLNQLNDSEFVNNKFVNNSNVVNNDVGNINNNNSNNSNNLFEYIPYSEKYNNYFKNDKIMSLYNKLNDETLKRNTILFKNNDDFIKQINEINKTQIKLLEEIYNEMPDENNNNNNNNNKIKINEKLTEINKQLNELQNLTDKNTKNKNIQNEIDQLIKLINK